MSSSQHHYGNTFENAETQRMDDMPVLTPQPPPEREEENSNNLHSPIISPIPHYQPLSPLPPILSPLPRQSMPNAQPLSPLPCILTPLPRQSIPDAQPLSWYFNQQSQNGGEGKIETKADLFSLKEAPSQNPQEKEVEDVDVTGLSGDQTILLFSDEDTTITAATDTSDDVSVLKDSLMIQLFLFACAEVLPETVLEMNARDCEGCVSQTHQRTTKLSQHLKVSCVSSHIQIVCV